MPKSLLRLIALSALAGIATTVLVFLWMSSKPDTYRTTATLVALQTIRTPQESIQYLADLDGALKAKPVLKPIAEETGIDEEVLKKRLAVNRIGSSSTVRLTYTGPSDDAELAQQVIEQATFHANNHLNRSRDDALESASANANRRLKAATTRLRSAQQALDEYIDVNGERDIALLAVNQERYAAELRVRLVTTDAATDAADREAARLRAIADASPTNVEAETAARAAESLLITNRNAAEALREELQRTDSLASELSAQARVQEELLSELDVAKAAATEASLAADEAAFNYAERGASFEIESTTATLLLTRASDAARRAIIAGASVAALIGLAGLWWQTAVSPKPLGPDLTPTRHVVTGPLELVAAPESQTEVAPTPPRELSALNLPRADVPPNSPTAGS